jgi:glycosyltransferase involved in cell wall biosynthesis
MKICYFNGGVDVPSVRFRMPFFQLLRNRGHECTFMESNPSRYEYFRWMGWRGSELLRRTVRRWHLSQLEEDKFAAVVLETEIFHNDDYSFEEKLRAVSGRLVYELDDAVFLLFPEKIEAICKMADRVIAGNQKIADWALRFNECVTVIPTCVDSDVYTAKNYSSQTSTKTPVVGWIGSSGNVRMLSVCASALREVASHRDFELRVISSNRKAMKEVDLKGVKVRWTNIDRCDTVAELQRFDIGIVPLPDDDPWMEYKCNAKMIQYMAVGVPALGSAIGFNQELVEHEVNSMLAADHDQWVQSLNALLDSVELRQRLGQAARQTILDSFTVQARIKEYEHAVLGAKFHPEKPEWKHPVP